MRELLNTPIFGIVISILTFEIGHYINKKTKLSFLNPLPISIILIIVFLKTFNISLDTYNLGGNAISILLGPATVVLAVPLYKQVELLKKNFSQIVVGIVSGCAASVTSIYLLSKLFKLDKVMELSLMPKSITTAVGIELSKQIGGIPSMTVTAIVMTGILGAIIGPFVCKVSKITDEIAVGIALGTSSHALGTTKAIELGEVQGAMSGLAIGVSAIVTVLITTILIRFL